MTKAQLEQELNWTIKRYVHFERAFRRWRNIALKYKARLKVINTANAAREGRRESEV